MKRTASNPRYDKMKLLMICLLSLSFAPRIWAGGTVLEGVVKDYNGNPLKGADVRVETRIGSYTSQTIKTDANGHYIASGLAQGTYKVTLAVNGSIKASILNASTQTGKPTQLNFDLRHVKAPVKTHMVWVAPDIGTHIGGGRWVEVDENGRVVSDATNTETLNSNAARQIQTNGLKSYSPVGH
jgi:hypothetical protein